MTEQEIADFISAQVAARRDNEGLQRMQRAAQRAERAKNFTAQADEHRQAGESNNLTAEELERRREQLLSEDLSGTAHASLFSCYREAQGANVYEKLYNLAKLKREHQRRMLQQHVRRGAVFVAQVLQASLQESRVITETFYRQLKLQGQNVADRCVVSPSSAVAAERSLGGSRMYSTRSGAAGAAKEGSTAKPAVTRVVLPGKNTR